MHINSDIFAKHYHFLLHSEPLSETRLWQLFCSKVWNFLYFNNQSMSKENVILISW